MDLVGDQTGKQEQRITIMIKTLIKEQWIHNLAEVVIEGPEVDIVKR